jgi:hypothetical protein
VQYSVFIFPPEFVCVDESLGLACLDAVPHDEGGGGGGRREKGGRKEKEGQGVKERQGWKKRRGSG